MYTLDAFYVPLSVHKYIKQFQTRKNSFARKKTETMYYYINYKQLGGNVGQ